MNDKVLLDSDFLYGLFVQEDPHHKICNNLLPKIEQSKIIVCNLVIYEMLTIFSRRFSQELAKSFLEDLTSFDIQKVFVDDSLEKEILAVFMSRTKKNISFVDCSNLVIATKYNCKIVSFDKFYPKELLIS